MAMKRLSRGVSHNDWVEIDIWTQEIKEGIGDKCVELYEAENNGVPNEFIALQNKFLRATKNLILASQDRNGTNAKLEFNRLRESCDECHAIFNEEDELKLENLTIVSPNQNVLSDK
ncbi:MAG: hypothetical protein SCALA701_34810 [Candidatus Scalindua sp.]|nr:MAG: hypothetical protein SCALA701_34810 [Candidatus Scalindua sp.]